MEPGVFELGPANAKNFDDGIIRNFSEVISQTVESTGANITELRSTRFGTRPRNAPYFSTRIYSLPMARIIVSGSGVISFISQHGDNDDVTEIGQGSNGTIYKGIRSNIVYKRIEINNSEEKFREIYLEAFIQTVLQNDPTYGRNICRIEKLYRDERLIDTVPVSRRRYIFIIKMEYIQNIKLNLYLESLKDEESNLVSFAAIKPMLRYLAFLLEHFQRNYGFYHGDLHSGNVLLNNDPTQIKIIDFGMACMKPITTGRIFSVKNIPCMSYDLLIYIMDLRQYHIKDFANDALIFFDSLARSPDGRGLYDWANEYLRLINKIRSPIFHLMYSDQIVPDNEFWRAGIPGVGTLYNIFTPLLEQNFLPVGFIHAIDNYHPPPRPGNAYPGFFRTGGRRRNTRKSIRQKHRKHRKHRNKSRRWC
jgi:serine/threonine protein kinase